jgi:hypothetical protein
VERLEKKKKARSRKGFFPGSCLLQFAGRALSCLSFWHVEILWNSLIMIIDRLFLLFDDGAWQ